MVHITIQKPHFHQFIYPLFQYVYDFNTSGKTTSGSLCFGLSEYSDQVSFLQSNIPKENQK